MGKDEVKVLFLSFILTMVIFIYNQQGDNLDKVSGDSIFSNKGVYVLNNIEIEYLYDKENYEVIPFVTDVYAVIKGDKGLLNVQRWAGKPKFYIDLRGKPVGVYTEKVQYEGINSKLNVDIYPKVIDVRLMEQQTVRFKPIVELVGVDKLDKNLVASVPVLLQDEVKVRGTQQKLSLIGGVKGVVDVSNLKNTSVLDVKLKVYDRYGREMNDITLLDKYIKVQVPIEKKVTIIKEEIIKNIVIEKAPKDIEKRGVLSFINVPSGLKLINLTENITLSKDFKIDLKDFKKGLYEVTLNDNGNLKVVKFELIDLDDSKNKTESESENKNEKNSDSKEDNQEKESDKSDSVDSRDNIGGDVIE